MIFFPPQYADRKNVTLEYTLANKGTVFESGFEIIWRHMKS